MVYIRSYQPSDLEPLVSLINTADSIDQAGMRTTVPAFRHSLDAGNDEPIFVAEAHGRLVGYIQLALDHAPGTRHYYGYGAVLPDHRRRGIGTALFHFALDYLQRLRAESSDRLLFDQFARLWIPGVEPLLLQLGFQRGKTLLTMRRPDMAQLAEPALPSAYQLRPVALPDAAACADVYTSAYQWRGDGTVRTAGEMAAEITAPQFRPDLFPVVVNPAGRVIGYAYAVLMRADAGGIEAGRIHTIAVDAAEQGRGIGRALLAECLRCLKKAGAPQAMLSVEADNPTPAMAMYQRSGFNEWRRAVLYHSPPLYLRLTY